MGIRRLVFTLLARLRSEWACKVRYRLFPVEFLRENGATIGVDCRFLSNFICTEPYLLRIGDHVSIGYGVELLPHEGAVWVLRGLEKDDNLDRFAPIQIGNNVFIGNGVKVLPGVVIGDNVVVGANSVVCKKLDSNAVYGGVPAHWICSIEEFRSKHLHHCISSKGMSCHQKRALVEQSTASAWHK
ncbi:acyltransferase [Desulforhopalus singaporensis]|uniref:Acetyltransferase (Isoleucine patch superfamily) n=1 Tax=Desulforhopalus singaporensis TaxID=91360 RepID=A0A1H0UXS1_9BACT|nr:acyltransferase [Desulforhopalus singaporensis]SDP70901.1 Acetyltransferase (isoleucine patch superfamily) [Desulforhopalus singaporensis]